MMPKIKSILPHSSLLPFIQNYRLLEFDTHCLDILWLRFACPDIYLVFFLKASSIVEGQKDYVLTESRPIWIYGISTCCNGVLKFNGEYSIFLVQFTPTGFNSLFGLPLKCFKNKIVLGRELFGEKISRLGKNLQKSGNLEEMAEYADVFFSSYNSLKKTLNSNMGIAVISTDILQSAPALNIKQYALTANMSLRNFERKFREQVGISPKLFCSVLRFNQSVYLKLLFPYKSWTAIALECGYYDQMHMVRDFKKFSDKSPSQIFACNLPPILKFKTFKRELLH